MVKWTDDRWEELKQLENLLKECSSLNSANNVIDRMQRIIEIADSLREWDIERRRKPFMRFLQDIAIDSVPEAK